MVEFRAERPIWSDQLEIYAKEQTDGAVYAWVCDGIKRVPAVEGMLWPRFMEATLLTDAGQSLFDALWNAGYRPNKGDGSGAHVEAIKSHLEDMRTLVFKESAE